MCVDGVAAGDRNACRLTYLTPAIENFPNPFRRELAEGHAEDGKGEDRPAPHGIDIGNGVGRRDPPEITRVVHHGREEVGRRDQAGTLVELPDGGVVARLGADQKLLEGLRGARIAEKRREDGRRQLATAAPAVGHAAETNALRRHTRLRSTALPPGAVSGASLT
jgi:hypothetical protein